MLAPARHSNANAFAYPAFDSEEDYAPGELYSGERICPPRAGSGGNAVLRAYVVIFIALVVLIGLAIYRDRCRRRREAEEL